MSTRPASSDLSAALRGMWFAPGATMTGLREGSLTTAFYVFLMAAGVAKVAVDAVNTRFTDGEVPVALRVTVLLSPGIMVALTYLYAIVLRWVARRIGLQPTLTSLVLAVGWGRVPAAFLHTAAIVLATVFIFSGTPASELTRQLVNSLIALGSLWTFFATVSAVRAVLETPWIKAFGVVVVAGAAVLVPVALLVGGSVVFRG